MENKTKVLIAVGMICFTALAWYAGEQYKFYEGISFKGNCHLVISYNEPPIVPRDLTPVNTTRYLYAYSISDGCQYMKEECSNLYTNTNLKCQLKGNLCLCKDYD